MTTTQSSTRPKAIGLALAAAGVALVTLAIRVSGGDGSMIGGSAGGLAAVSVVLFLRSNRPADPVDERWQLIHYRSMAAAAMLTIAGVLAAYLLIEARGGDGSPYALVALFMALCYLGSRAWYGWRL